MYDGHFFTQVGVVMSYVIWAMSYSFPVFIVARIVGGISKGNVSLSAAIVTDVTTPAQRSKGMVGKVERLSFVYLSCWSFVCTVMLYVFFIRVYSTVGPL